MRDATVQRLLAIATPRLKDDRSNCLVVLNLRSVKSLTQSAELSFTHYLLHVCSSLLPYWDSAHPRNFQSLLTSQLLHVARYPSVYKYLASPPCCYLASNKESYHPIMVAYIPEILWAQRSSATDESKNIVYLTVNIIDSEKPKLKLTSTSLSFDSKSDDDNNEYKFGIDFYEEINVEKSREHQTGRGVFFVLQKTTKKAEYWPRLTKEKKKFPYIKTDFDKWVDEDEQDKPETEDDYGFGGAPGGDYGFGGAPGGTPTGLDSLDFSQLAGGFPGLGGGKGMPDLSALGGLGGGADEEAGEASADASEQAEEAKDAEEAKEAESK